MESTAAGWKNWRQFFENRRHRELPSLSAQLPADVCLPSLARSLAIFQLGESGGGTVIEQAGRSQLDGITPDYAAAMALFVNEEHRHANILAICVRMLGGELIDRNWTAYLFRKMRRLIGLRIKVFVLLAAEVVGICYYRAIAEALGAGPLKNYLGELANDETAHLAFHCEFLRRQTQRAWQRTLFRFAWRTTTRIASIVVRFDHRHCLTDLEIDVSELNAAWADCAKQAENLVTERGDAPVRQGRPASFLRPSKARRVWWPRIAAYTRVQQSSLRGTLRG